MQADKTPEPMCGTVTDFSFTQSVPELSIVISLAPIENGTKNS